MVLVAGLLAAPTAPASAAIWAVPAPDPSLAPLLHLTEYENRVVFLINKHRKKAHRAPVRYFGSCLDRLSERWSRHLVDIDTLVHRGQRKVLRRCDLTWTGETLASGTGLLPGALVRAWMHSPEHRAVIMKPRANRAGVGVRINGAGKVFAVLNFGDVD